MIPRLLLSMLTSFLLTEAVECGAAFILGLRSREGMRLVFLANLLTNPAVVLLSILIPMRTPDWVTYGLVLDLLELWAFLTEAFLYLRYRERVGEMLPLKHFPAGGPYLLSGILNVLSFGAGYVISGLM